MVRIIALLKRPHADLRFDPGLHFDGHFHRDRDGEGDGDGKGDGECNPYPDRVQALSPDCPHFPGVKVEGAAHGR